MRRHEPVLNFKLENSLESRRELASKLRSSYADRVPVIVEKDSRSSVPDISRKKFLAPADISFAKFMAEIRRHLKVSSEKAIFVFVGGRSGVSPMASMQQVYEQYKDKEDGFLYCVYSSESTFG